MNLPQWITLACVVLMLTVVPYMFAVTHWLNNSALFEKEPWWVRLATRFVR